MSHETINEQAVMFYNNLPFNQRTPFQKKVKSLMNWTPRQFRYRFISGKGMSSLEAEKIERSLKLKKGTIFNYSPEVKP